MRTVCTQNELEEAIKAHEEKILCKGEIARQFAKKKKRKRAARIGGTLIAIGGIAAIPLTSGASLLAMGAVASGLTIGSITIGAAELAIIVGGVIALTGIVLGGKVTFKNDGTVEFEPKYNKEKE